jgi:selenocysteine-specific elongation factor
MRPLVLGTAGHIDHGKTALVRALTGQDPDRLPEEKRRGITIDLGFAHLPLAGFEYAVVDVPGHESLVRNMLAGASGIDVVLLVVAADEGVMPQTREHLAIMELLAVRQAVVAITKADLVTDEWLELVCDDVRAVLASSRFALAPLVPVSAVTGSGLPRLRDELASAAARCPARSREDIFRMPIDRVFTLRGTGTVVTGTVWSGRVRSDSMLRALPTDLAVRVRGLHRHGAAADEAGAGERVALALALPRETLQRGITLVDHPGWQPASNLTVELSLLADAPPLRVRQRVRLHLGTSEVLARCASFGDQSLGPGKSAWVQLRLEAPVVARTGDRFVIRSYSPVRTIAGGIVAEPAAPRRKRIEPATMELLEQVVRGPARVIAAVGLAGPGGVPTGSLPLLTGMSPGRLQPPWPDDVHAAGDRLFPAAASRDLREQLLAAIDAFHRNHPLEPGPSREELRRSASPGTSQALLEHLIGRLLADGRVASDGAALFLPGFQPNPTPEHQQLADQLLAILAAAGLAAPRVAELPPALRDHPDFHPVARYLMRRGTVVALAHDHLADPAALDAAAASLASAFREHPRQSASRLKEVLGLTRKHLIPLLEYFDRAGVTRRDGDDRTAGTGLRTTSDESG